jgi:hypothetical protein
MYSIGGCGGEADRAFRWGIEVAYDGMAVLAADNWVLVFTQMPLTLLPPPMNKAAEAKATKDIRRVYSIRS